LGTGFAREQEPFEHSDDRREAAGSWVRLSTVSVVCTNLSPALARVVSPKEAPLADPLLRVTSTEEQWGRRS